MKREFIERGPVILYNSRMHLFPGKLRLRWLGPCKVTEVLANGVVEVENYKGERFKTNGQRLKKYCGRSQDVQVVHAININDA